MTHTMALLDAVRVPLLLVRADGPVIHANSEAHRLLGRDLGDLRQPWMVDVFPSAEERTLAQGWLDGEQPVREKPIRLVAANGELLWVLLSLEPISHGGELAKLLTLVDITEQKHLEEELSRVAVTDALTGVYNRRHFLDRVMAELSRADRYARPLSLIMVDIDHFKQINEVHGHRLGDEAIRRVARCCTRLLRQHDHLGRMGGEEFAALTPDTGLDEARLLAERLRAAAEEIALETPSGERIHVTISCGVAQLHPGEALPEPLFARADEALFAAKQAGRNRVGTEVV